ncbi:MAG: S-methyl-5'-thioadenosine phosphorylase [Sandaracinaceae bacterium]
MSERTLGVIGGSGLYDMEGLVDVREHDVETTFGRPSDVVIEGRLGETRLLFLPRHGRGHRFAPHEVNYRANVLALKGLGAEQIVSISAVGSMKETIHPGDVVLVDQFIDRTRHRPNTYFEGVGVVAHVELAEPVDATLQEALYRAAVSAGARAHRGGTYVCIEGPQFSTRAESNLFRSWGIDVIGMTNLPEARLAREAELPYATLALVTDYDCWHQTEASVSVESVLAVLRRNVAMAQTILKDLAKAPPDPSTSPATRALNHAVLTPPDRIGAEARIKLAPLIGRLLASA